MNTRHHVRFKDTADWYDWQVTPYYVRNDSEIATYFAGEEGWADGMGGWGRIDCDLKGGQTMIITHEEKGFDLELLEVHAPTHTHTVSPNHCHNVLQEDFKFGEHTELKVEKCGDIAIEQAAVYYETKYDCSHDVHTMSLTDACF